LSDYLASDTGAELRDRLFSPVFFNPIDWTEVELFDKPLFELADYLNDERVFGIHLWTARNPVRARDDGVPLISLLSDPLENFPTFSSLADRFNTDKNRHTGNRHCYARIYDRLLSGRRLAMRLLMEIGLCRGLAEGDQTETPSVTLWQSYFPFCQVVGVDLTDFSRLNNDRFTSFVCDQSKQDELRAVAAKLSPGSFASAITLTKTLLREIRQHGAAQSSDPLGISELVGQIAEILFFDSHYELNRAKLLGELVAIRKRGGSGFVR
jgi:hypothetical protein